MEPNIVAVLSCALPLPQNIADRTSTRNSFQLFDRMFLNILRPLELSVCLMIFISTPNDSSFNEQLSRIFMGSVTKLVTNREKNVSRPGWDCAENTYTALIPIPNQSQVDGTFSAEKLVGHEADLKGVLTDRTASVLLRYARTADGNSTASHRGRFAIASFSTRRASSSSAPTSSMRGARTRALPTPTSCCTSLIS